MMLDRRSYPQCPSISITSNMMGLQDCLPDFGDLRSSSRAANAMKILRNPKSLLDARRGIRGHRQPLCNQQETPFLGAVLKCGHSLIGQLPGGDAQMPVGHPFEEQLLQECSGTLRGSAFRSIPPSTKVTVRGRAGRAGLLASPAMQIG